MAVVLLALISFCEFCDGSCILCQLRSGTHLRIPHAAYANSFSRLDPILPSPLLSLDVGNHFLSFQKSHGSGIMQCYVTVLDRSFYT